MKRGCPMHPPGEYEQLRREQPITRIRMPDGQLAWLVTQHGYGRELLVDPRVSVNRTSPRFPIVMKVDRKQWQQAQSFNGVLLSVDEPEHGPQRRMLASEFSSRRIATLRPRVQQIVDERIDAMLSGPKPADLVQELSLPVPSLVICELLGVKYDDRAYFQSVTDKLISRGSSPEERAGAVGSLQEYLVGLIMAKMQDPGDDIFSRLVQKNLETRVFDEGQLVALAALLLVAGHETTANMISLGVSALLQAPEFRAELAARPDAAPAAVDELMRYCSIVDSAIARVATEDIEIGGVRIEAGDGIVVEAQAAGWDPDAFEQPEQLRLDRTAHNHLGFGYGVHQCLGQNLARLELSIVFTTLLTRIPELRLAVAAEQVSYSDEAGLPGIPTLPLTW